MQIPSMSMYIVMHSYAHLKRIARRVEALCVWCYSVARNVLSWQTGVKLCIGTSRIIGKTSKQGKRFSKIPLVRFSIVMNLKVAF